MIGAACSGGEGEIGEIHIDPGETATLTVNLEPGTYAAECHRSGHFEAGMHDTFVVVEGTGPAIVNIEAFEFKYTGIPDVIETSGEVTFVVTNSGEVEHELEIIRVSDDTTIPTTTVADPGMRVVEITMTEFAFDPDTIEVQEGETIKFVLVNEGMIEHEFRVATQHDIGDHDHGDHGDEAATNKVLVQPGETVEFEYTFDSEQEVSVQELFFVCLIPGHYEAGMVGEFDFGDDAVHDDHEEEATHDDHEDEVVEDEHGDEATHDDEVADGEHEDEGNHHEDDEDGHDEEQDDQDEGDEGDHEHEEGHDH